MEKSTKERAALEKAVRNAGSQSALARELGVAQGHVWYWINVGRLPAERVVDVETITGVGRELLRPDIYGKL